jgi:hypothetical protein
MWISAVIIILMIPLVAMRFTDEVSWDLFDFAIMGAVLIGVGISYEFIATRSKKFVYRMALGTGLVGAFLLFWVNGAVGIIGNEGQDANLLYGVVIVVGSVGALIARFKPKGMSNALIAAAVVQALVPVIALLIWPPPTTSWAPGVVGVFLLSTFFALVFLVSALLFRQASSKDSFAV